MEESVIMRKIMQRFVHFGKIGFWMCFCPQIELQQIVFMTIDVTGCASSPEKSRTIQTMTDEKPDLRKQILAAFSPFRLISTFSHDLARLNAHSQPVQLPKPD